MLRPHASSTRAHQVRDGNALLLTLDPPASVSAAHRSRLPESPFIRPKKSTIGVDFDPNTPGSSRRAAAQLNSPVNLEAPGIGDDLSAEFDRHDLQVSMTEEVETTIVEERTMDVDEMEDEQDDVDSQPVAKRRRSSEKAKGPHPPVSSAITDSFNERMDEDDASEPGEPFDYDNGQDEPDEPMDGMDEEPQPNGHSDDDADLEQRAMDEENMEDNSDDGDESRDLNLILEENLAQMEKQGHRKRGAPTTPNQKIKRVSTLPAEGDKYRGDFVTRRSGRNHFKPLEYWRGERMEYERGEHGPVVKSVVHVPPVETRPRNQARRARGRGRGRSTTARAQSASVGPEPAPAADQFFDIDRHVDTMMPVTDYATGDIISRSKSQQASVADNRNLPSICTRIHKACAGRFIPLPEGLRRGRLHRRWSRCHRPWP